MLQEKRVGQRQPLAPLGPHVAPPHPGRNAGDATQLQQSVGGSSGVVSFDKDLAPLHADAEAVVAAFALHDAYDAVAGGDGFPACHGLHVALEEADGLLHCGRRLTFDAVAHGAAAVIPHHFGSGRRRYQGKQCKDKRFHRQKAVKGLLLVQTVRVEQEILKPQYKKAVFVVVRHDIISHDHHAFKCILDIL